MAWNSYCGRHRCCRDPIQSDCRRDGDPIQSDCRHRPIPIHLDPHGHRGHQRCRCRRRVRTRNPLRGLSCRQASNHFPGLSQILSHYQETRFPGLRLNLNHYLNPCLVRDCIDWCCWPMSQSSLIAKHGNRHFQAASFPPLECYYWPGYRTSSFLVYHRATRRAIHPRVVAATSEPTQFPSEDLGSNPSGMEFELKNPSPLSVWHNPILRN